MFLNYQNHQSKYPQFKIPEGKRQLRKPRRRWEDNIRMDLQEVGCGVWTGLGCFGIETVGGNCEFGNKVSGSIKRREFLH
jgi:hypothetical protein